MSNHILIIEDNPTMRSFLSVLLGQKYKLITKESGEGALAWLDGHNHTNLIICDYKLGGIDGLEFIRRVKSLDQYQRTPFIFLSGKNGSDTRVACLKAGAHDFIVKPFNPGELMLKVERIIESS